MLECMAVRQWSDVGGTPGGLGDFLLGFAMACAGAYLLTSHVMVASSYWSFYGGNTFGITLIPMPGHGRVNIMVMIALGVLILPSTLCKKGEQVSQLDS